MTWTETITGAGEVYYFNSKTGESTWNKPEGVPIFKDSGKRTDAEKPASVAVGGVPLANASAMAKISGSTSSMTNVAGSWRELTAQDGRKYYMNTVTKATVWEMPVEFKEYTERQLAGGGIGSVDKKQAEEIFMKVLEEVGVKSDLEWEQALRLVIDHPQYKCIPTLHERKEAFIRYKDIARQRERDERARKAEKAREAFIKILDEETRIQVGTRWVDAMEYLRDREEYAAVVSPRDRVDIFEEYMEKFKRTGRSKKPSPTLEKFSLLIRKIPGITVETKWKEAIQIFSTSDEYTKSPEFQKLDPIDMLLEFENYIKDLEQAEVKQQREEYAEERRKLRLARKEMKTIVKDLVDNGQFTALTSWREFYGMVSHHGCFEEMISSHPSDPTPLDYYWDALDELQPAYISDRKIILNASGGPEYPRELRKFVERVRRDPASRDIRGLHHVELVFKELSLRREYPQTRLIENQPSSSEVDRKLIERYKHLIKHWSGPTITLESTYDQFRPLFEAHSEFQDLSDEPTRRIYFDKYIHHLRKKSSGPGNNNESIPKEEGEVEEGELVEEEDRDYQRRRSYRR